MGLGIHTIKEKGLVVDMITQNYGSNFGRSFVCWLLIYILCHLWFCWIGGIISINKCGRVFIMGGF